MNLAFTVIIPARYASTRFPGKPLANLAGKPMLLHACDRALESGAAKVLVATDDRRIADAVSRASSVQVIMTDSNHQSGTDRLAQAVEQLALPDDATVINLQGDEPLMPPGHIRRVAKLLTEAPDADMSTLVMPIRDPEEVANPNVVKAVLDSRGYALYFSRAPIPWSRDTGGQAMTGAQGWHRHLGLYGYRAGFLRAYPSLEAPAIERLEALEQLRALWHGHRIVAAVVEQDGGPGIDTPADLKRAESIIGTLLGNQDGQVDHE